MDDTKLCKIFTIHFRGKRVYIGHTSNSLYDKIENMKNDRDHDINFMFKKYPNPEIRVECYGDQICNMKLVASKYLKDKYKILNVNIFPYGYKKNN